MGRLRPPTVLTLIGAVIAGALVAAPLAGWPRVVRLPGVVVPGLAIAALAVPRAYWKEAPLRDPAWRPSLRVVWSAALIVFLFLSWYVLTRFRAGEINAVDFTIYYDRPCAQTARGRPLLVEVSDTPALSYRSELGDHAYWAMLLACAPYRLHATPAWLHALAALAVTLGAVHVLRIALALGAGGALAGATALAFVLNDNTARALNYGFHPEVLYAWFVPWMIHAGLRRARASFLAATILAVLVKEDACLPLFAASVLLAFAAGREMKWGERLLFLALPPAAALANMAVYHRYVVPLLTGDPRWTYAHFWAPYGDTPVRAVLGMLAHPGRVLSSTLSSGFFRTLQPHLFLPLVGWRWSVGAAPIVLLYGASANDQVRDFGIYYAIVLVPFFSIAATMGALALTRRLLPDPARAQLAAAAVVLLGPLLVGSGHRGYSLRPWRAEIAAMPAAVAALSGEARVLVQSGLFPHAGYDERFRLLTPETLRDPANAGAVVLLAERIGAYPFGWRDLEGLRRLPAAASLPAGLAAVRLSPGAGALVPPPASTPVRVRRPGFRGRTLPRPSLP